MNYPTMVEVVRADRPSICRWWRFLPSPTTPQMVKIMNAIAKRFHKFGGFTPEISKALGWKEI
jgi:hypothetical protein